MLQHVKDLYYLEEIGKHYQGGGDSLGVLLVCTTSVFGGGETHTISLYKNLQKKGHRPIILVLKDSLFSDMLRKQQIPHYECSYFKDKIFKITFRPGISHVREICKKHDIDVVHCNTEEEVNTLRRRWWLLPSKVVFTRHVPNPLNGRTLSSVDGVIAVSPEIESMLTETYEKEKLTKKPLVHISPLVDQSRYSNLNIRFSRKTFFNKYFGVNIGDGPVFSTVANMYKDVMHKNHHVLFRAVKRLYDNGKRFDLILAGDGVGRSNLESYAKELGIQKIVHFLGTTDKVPEVLYHSDFHVISSAKEALGLVAIEAALLGKPSIGASDTGLVNVIVDGQTGLLFSNNDEIDLSEKILLLLDNPERCKELGRNACDLVKEKFSPDLLASRHVEFYHSILR